MVHRDCGLTHALQRQLELRLGEINPRGRQGLPRRERPHRCGLVERGRERYGGRCHGGFENVFFHKRSG